MPPHIIDIRQAEDRRDVVHRAVQTLVEGQLVVFPTETVYGVGASALSAEGVEKLYQAKGRSQDAPLALAIKSAEEALDYVPQLGRLGQRLARRCWPGPVTLVLDYEDSHGLVSQLPGKVRRAVAPKGTIGFRVPAHEVILDVLRLLVGPIALTSANKSGETPAASAQQAVQSLGDNLGLVLDDGPSRYGQASTVVRVSGNNCNFIREGVVGQTALDRLSSMIVLFVCTGNTCRSPMAEAMMRQLIAEKMGCSVSELEERNVAVVSAGISAALACRPSEEAVDIMKKRGLDLSNHESQPLTDKMVRHSDIIFTMTAGHRHAIVTRWPDAAMRTHTLRHDGHDIQDPIGRTADVYEECAKEIESALLRRLDEIEINESV